MLVFIPTGNSKIWLNLMFKIKQQKNLVSNKLFLQ